MITLDEIKLIVPRIEKSEIVTAKDNRRYKLVKSDNGIEVFVETRAAGYFAKSKETLEAERALNA